MFSLVILHDILPKDNTVCKALQKPDIDFSEAVKIISQVNNDLVKTHIEYAFKEMKNNAETI